MAKHTLAKSFAVYEKIVLSAWQTTWRHKELWFFGLLAGVAYSGSVLQTVFSQLVHLRPADRISARMLETSSDTITYIVAYGRTLIGLPPAKLALVVFSALFVLAVVAYMLVMAQHLLLTSIHLATKKKKHLSAVELFHERKHAHVVRLFSVDAIVYLATLLLTLGASLPLMLLLSESIFGNFLVYTAFYLLMLPLLFILNMLAMFTLVHITRRDEGIDGAFMRAVHALHGNWVAAGEMAAILFLINLGGFIAFSGSLALLALLSAPLVIAATGLQAALLVLLLGSAITVTGAAIYVIYFGGMTTFNYVAWTAFIDRVERPGFKPALEAVVTKFIN